MIITLTKEQKGMDAIKEMEETYGSFNDLKRLYEKTNNMNMLVDMENWEYLLENPDETIEESTSIVTNKLTLTDLEMELLDFIKKEKPQSIRELARMIHKDVSIIQPKIKELEKEGLINIKEGSKNRKIPYLNYDKITVSI